MSMIKVQTTRTQKSETSPQGREKYFSAGPNSSAATPFYVGSIILALAMYLKSVLGSSAVSPVTPTENKSTPENPLNPETADVSSTTDKPGLQEFISAAGDEPPKPQHLMGSSTHGATPLDYNHDYGLSRVEFVQPALQKLVTVREPVNFPVLPSNDNLQGFSNGAGSGIVGAQTANDPRDTGDTSVDDDHDDVIKDGDNPDGDGETKTLNRRPVVARSVVLYDQFACMAVMIALADLLRGATDADGDVLRIKNATVSSGELILTDGGFSYHGDEIGPVTITYLITDGEFEVLQTATFNVLPKPPIIGTPNDDNLVGTNCKDSVFGLDGNDQIDGRGGDDEIYGGSGNDHIVGGDGDDVIFGQNGNDILLGGLGNDILFGGQGNDWLFGGSGNDILLGGEGDDQLAGDTGNDVLLGGTGQDRIADGAGNDQVDGEAGDDVLIAAADADDDMFSGGTGTDRLDYSASTTNLTFDLVAKTVTSADVWVDQFAGIEIFVGGAANDTFRAASTTEDADFSETPQSFIGGVGFDTLDYSETNSALTIDVAHNLATGEAIGTDSFDEIEHFVGSNGDDNFIVGQGSITLDGRDGDDMFEFLTSAAIDDSSNSSHHIVGFDPGDWVRMSKYDIFENVMDTLQDAFEEFYGDDHESSAGEDTLDNVVPIRIRYEVFNSIDNTYIEADFDHDLDYEISVHLDGHHSLFILNNNLTI